MYHFKAFGYSVGVVIHGPAILLKKKNTNDSHVLFQFILPELIALAFLHRMSAWDLHFLSRDLLSLLERNPQSSDLEDP